MEHGVVCFILRAWTASLFNEDEKITQKSRRRFWDALLYSTESYFTLDNTERVRHRRWSMSGSPVVEASASSTTQTLRQL